MRHTRWLVIIAVPLVLIMCAVRIFTLPWYPSWEYNRPGFPEDPLGMPDSERLRLANACIRFLNVPNNPEILASLHFQDGGIVFNDRELGHMDDVKMVYDSMSVIASAFALISVVWLIVAIRKGLTTLIYQTLFQGGILSLSMLIALGLWMLVGFDAFFTTFHGLFFSEGTWLFAYTDTLIRLFPIKFWQDAGMGIAVLVTSVSLLLTGVSWRIRKFPSAA